MTNLLPPLEKAEFENDIHFLISLLADIVELLKINLTLFNAKEVKNYSKSLLDIVARFRYNTESISNLMDAFSKDYRLKCSINLILRSICSDSLTALYLITFYNEQDREHVALKNELDILSSEYALFVRKSLEANHEFLVRYGLNFDATFEEKLDWFHNEFSGLIDKDGKVLSKKSFRETTPDEVKKTLDNAGKFISEEQKYERIKKSYGHYGYLFINFKYYSQFQHFNPMSQKMIERSPLNDTKMMIRTLDHMMNISLILFKIAGSANNHLTEDIRKMNTRIEKHLN